MRGFLCVCAGGRDEGFLAVGCFGMGLLGKGLVTSNRCLLMVPPSPQWSGSWSCEVFNWLGSERPVVPA